MQRNTLGVVHEFLRRSVQPGAFCIDATAGKGRDAAKNGAAIDTHPRPPQASRKRRPPTPPLKPPALGGSRRPPQSPPTENGARTTAEGPGESSRRLMASNQASLSPRRNQIPNEPQGQTGPLGAKQTIGLPGVKPASRDSRRSAMGGGASPAQALAGFERLAPEQLRLTHPKLQDSQLGPHQER